MNYGLPYMGSKNKIAEWVVGHFPERKHFYDLFAGGCAVTHCAMLKSKFETFTINDISKMTEFFTDAISGKYADERRWISREDFFRLKDNDEYVRICWSFGNQGFCYLYSKELEPWKKALHYARVYGDFSLMEEFGIRTDGTSIDIKKNAAEYKEKYFRWYLKNVLKTSAEYESLQSLQRLQRLQRLQMRQSLESLQRLQKFRGDYRSVKIKPDSLIYCDIPYKNTAEYSDGGFDYESFYDWAEKQIEPVIISEYAMPAERFERIDFIEKRSLLSSVAKSIRIEGLFVPKTQIKKGIFSVKKKEWKQLELF